MIPAVRIAFDPALPAGAIAALALLAAIAWGLYLWRGGGAPVTRALGFVLLFAGAMQPQWVRETREPADDVALVLIDQSESLALVGRLEAARAAGAEMAARLRREPGLDVRVRETRGGPDGTLIPSVITEALADVARGRVAGIVAITDGQAADPPANPRELAELGPAHILIVGDPARADARLQLISAPQFGIVGEPLRVAARVHDARARQVRVRASIDGAPAGEVLATANRDFHLDLRLPKRGPNMVILEADASADEISAANNRAAFVATGVRDRSRVLLITGEPHQGARVWRNLLKADPAVDLVHFTILRPPDKADAALEREVSLIPFPTEELFERRLGQFDLIIFDRAPQRGVLESYYLAAVARRTEQGGALLIAAGASEAGLDGLWSTPLAEVLPARPTGVIVSRPYRPSPSALGRRHPVVRGLPTPERWGRWTRQIEARAERGDTVLEGADGRPLLVLNRVGQGRVAQLWSDQPWLWARGYDGGGPHGELLRRLAHWLMQEPELEEERLSLTATAQGLQIEHATLGAEASRVELIAPSGARSEQRLPERAPGLRRLVLPNPAQGLYEARAGELRAFAAVGPLNPREAAALNADPEILRPYAQATDGGVFLTGEDGARLPQVRRVARGASASGGDWIGVERNQSYVVRAARASPLGPGWAWALTGLALLMWGWRRESV
jgi:hypothetical protein